VIQLTTVGDVEGCARVENGENTRILKASGVCRAVLDLEGETENMNTHGCLVTRRVTYLGALERWARASGVGNAEGVLGEGVQDSTRIV